VSSGAMSSLAPTEAERGGKGERGEGENNEGADDDDDDEDEDEDEEELSISSKAMNEMGSLTPSTVVEKEETEPVLTGEEAAAAVGENLSVSSRALSSLPPTP